MKLSEMDGLLPEKKNHVCNEYSTERARGFNQAIDQLSNREVEIVFDREKLRNILESMMVRDSKSDEENPGYFRWIFSTKRGFDLCDIADALINSQGIATIKCVQ